MPEQKTKQDLIQRIKTLETEVDELLSVDQPFNEAQYKLQEAKEQLKEMLLQEALNEDE